MASILQGVAVFAGLDPAGLAELSGQSQEVRLPARRPVFRRGEPGDCLYVVGHGRIAIVHDVVGEPVEHVRDLGPGELFGEMEVLEGSARLFSAKTVEPSNLHRIPAAAFRRFLAVHPQTEVKLRTLCIQRRTSRLHAVLGPSTRKEPRIRVDRRATLTLADGTRTGVLVEDMSSCGLCLSGAPDAWQAGQAVRFSLGIPGRPDPLAVEGGVRWRDGDLLGIAFDATDHGSRRRAEQAMRELIASAR